jgi:hypothetical protein
VEEDAAEKYCGLMAVTLVATVLFGVSRNRHEILQAVHFRDRF